MSNDVRYGYFRVVTSGGPGFVCVALQRPPHGEGENPYIAGFSFCSPREAEFTKARARTIATGRLNSVRKDSEFKVEFKHAKMPTDACFHLREVFIDALRNMLKSGGAPGWLSRAAKRGNVYLGLRDDEQMSRGEKFSQHISGGLPL